MTGPRSRELSRRIAAVEAPGVNTLPSTPGAVSLFWEEAEGAQVRDVDGTSYIDLTSGFGVAAVGHRHPRVVEAVREQAGRLMHGLGDVHGHPLRVELAERLVRLAPVDDSQVFFSISGSEAVEIAVKTALAATRRPEVLAFEPSYHGLTMGALALTSRPEFRKPFAAHLHGHVHRLPFACDPGQVEAVLRSGQVGAVVVEPIVGREGILIPPKGWLEQVAQSCQRYGTLLIADEVFTGFGRTGRWFAVEHEAVRPDILCCGKALGGGMPIAAVLARRELFRVWETEKEALHTATFVANPVACAAALAVLSVIEEEDLPARAARMGEWVGRRLASFSQVAAVRGRGLLWGVEMKTAEAARAWTGKALARGVILLAGGPEGKVAQIVPPLTIPEEMLERALNILEETLGFGRAIMDLDEPSGT